MFSMVYDINHWVTGIVNRFQKPRTEFRVSIFPMALKHSCADCPRPNPASNDRLGKSRRRFAPNFQFSDREELELKNATHPFER
jgi:hypothetical protein